MAPSGSDLSHPRPNTVRLAIQAEEGPGILAGSELRGDPNAPLLWFVHGFQSERLGNKAQALLAAAAGRGWSFTSYDFRGHGESSPTHPLSVEHPLAALCHSSLTTDMERIAQHLDTWHGGPRILIGSSMGGYASAWHAALHPKRVQGLVLVAPAWRFGQTILGRVEKLSPGASQIWKEAGWFDYPGGMAPTRLSWRLVEEAEAHPYHMLARRIGCPVRVLHAMDDDVIDYQESVEALKHLSVDAHLLLTRTGGHRLIEHVDQLVNLGVELAGNAYQTLRAASSQP